MINVITLTVRDLKHFQCAETEDCDVYDFFLSFDICDCCIYWNKTFSTSLLYENRENEFYGRKLNSLSVSSTECTCAATGFSSFLLGRFFISPLSVPIRSRALRCAALNIQSRNLPVCRLVSYVERLVGLLLNVPVSRTCLRVCPPPVYRCL